MTAKRLGHDTVGRIAARSRRTRATLRLLAALFGAALLLVAGCSGDQGGGDTVTVTIKDLKFTPETVTVSPGTTVRWVNNDATAHTSTSAAFNPDEKSQPAGAWDSPILNPGQSWSHRFDRPGTYDYGCSIHPYIVGTVRVRGR